MALAILRQSRVPGPPGTVSFTLELGNNRFYQYAVGDETVDRGSGFPMLGAAQFTSPLIGPLPESSLGRTSLDIPSQRFDRDHRYVQVTTYRTRARDGPTVSDILRAVVVSPNAGSREDFPSLSFSLRDPMDPYTIENGYGVASGWRGPVPMAYREVRPMSSAMFLGSL